jgi:uncharacterized membrane protein
MRNDPMNLDLVPLGWVHLIASLLALSLGLLVLLRTKGTPTHKRRGRIYAAALLATSVTALGIYRRGIFFFPHWLAIASLIAVGVGFGAVHFRFPRVGWMQIHLTCMLTSLYILIGGGVNELFLRVNVLRRIAPSLDTPVVGMTHLSVIVLFAMLIAWFNAATLLRRRGSGQVLRVGGRAAE